MFCTTFGNGVRIKTLHVPLHPIKASPDAGKYFCNLVCCFLISSKNCLTSRLFPWWEKGNDMFLQLYPAALWRSKTVMYFLWLSLVSDPSPPIIFLSALLRQVSTCDHDSYKCQVFQRREGTVPKNLEDGGVTEDIESSSQLCPCNLPVIVKLYKFIVIVTSGFFTKFCLAPPELASFPLYPWTRTGAPGALVGHGACPSCLLSPRPPLPVFWPFFSSPAVATLLLALQCPAQPSMPSFPHLSLWTAPFPQLYP